MTVSPRAKLTAFSILGSYSMTLTTGIPTSPFTCRAFILLSGRKVNLPSLFLFKNSIAFSATISSSTTTLSALLPKATSTAMEYFSSLTLINSSKVPYMPGIPDLLSSSTALLLLVSF
ncbi:117aa long hypothetical protein [Pyrococcus horikoshii OT3]|uniref:Uncharacterized protein n=1 Tax=Pyrococcus horikoshii (strain ATCC 700860 / DSM 12428 / JCM 9974 / NBRC 100139 / OT-3) TaxID=70601 RepID=O59463_PYRHO|nr:117aa long hypothetical protein [Pyrococcus horikoshii OT3]